MLKAPFPWFGGKSRAAALIWPRFGAVTNYVEPFFGSGAVLLQRPHGWTGTETVNDKDGFVANFWRALQAAPDEVSRHADWPVNENDLHARHAWLIEQRATLTPRLEGDPAFYDALIAGWWVWGIACWIGSGWCAGDGPWRVVDGQLVHLGDSGRGVHRKLVHLGDAGRGVHRDHVDGLFGYLRSLADRLRGVRVCCGDWTRVLGPTPTVKLGTTAVLLDPPYADTADRSEVYAVDCDSVAHAVRVWALEHGDDPRLRIALCGYDGEHQMPDTWQRVAWKAHGGYGSQGDGRGRENASREMIWFSPHCLRVDAPVPQSLFT